MNRSSTDIAKNTNARSRDPASYLSLDVRSKFLETKPSQLLACLYVVSGMNGSMKITSSEEVLYIKPTNTSDKHYL